MGSDTTTAEKIEDARAQVAHQIETNRHYESISWQFLRLVLAIIGISLTLMSIAVSAVLSDDWVLTALSQLADIDPQSFAQSAAQDLGFAGMFTGGVITAMIFIGLSLLTLVSLIDIFVKAPGYAYKIQNPPDIMEGIDLDQEVDSLQDILTGYQDAIAHNEEIIEETENRWESCLHHLRQGIALFFVSIFLSSMALLTQSVVLVVLIISFIIVSSLGKLNEKIELDEVIKYLYINKISNIGTGGILASMIFYVYVSEDMELAGLALLLMILSAALIVLGGLAAELDELNLLIVRTGALFVLSLFFLFTAFIAQDFTDEIPPREADILVFAFFILLATTILLIFVYGAKQAHTNIWLPFKESYIEDIEFGDFTGRFR